MAPVGFEPTTSAGERPKTYSLDRTATGTGTSQHYQLVFFGGRVSRKSEVTVKIYNNPFYKANFNTYNDIFNRCSTVHFDKYEVFFPTNALFIKT
jgi:hypothetical protein